MAAESVVNARILLTQAMGRTRYAGSLSRRIPTPEPWAEDPGEAAFLGSVILWLEELNETLVSVASANEDMRDELDQYRAQQRAIRTFLGTNQIGE